MHNFTSRSGDPVEIGIIPEIASVSIPVLDLYAQYLPQELEVEILPEIASVSVSVVMGGRWV